MGYFARLNKIPKKKKDFKKKKHFGTNYFENSELVLVLCYNQFVQ